MTLREFGSIVLWDLDGTIISAGTDPGEPFEAALTVFGAEVPVDRPTLHGQTDLAICRDYLLSTGRSPADALAQAPHLLREVERVTIEDASTVSSERYVLPGVLDVLRASRAAGVRHALATGNSKLRAHQKLTVTSVWNWFETSISAFGDETTERSDLVRLAASRIVASSSGDVPRLVVFGDTPTDISAAKSSGYPVVAISTGAFSYAQLKDAQPDLVVSSLQDGYDQVMNFLLC